MKKILVILFFLLIIVGCSNTAQCESGTTPVCGVDGKTYPTPCDASTAGVKVASGGACAPSSTPNDEVAICTMDYNPVCGVDGKTYGNACGAKVAKVQVAHTGECAALPLPLGAADVVVTVYDGQPMTIEPAVMPKGKETIVRVDNRRSTVTTIRIPQLDVDWKVDPKAIKDFQVIPNNSGYYSVELNAAQAGTIHVE